MPSEPLGFQPPTNDISTPRTSTTIKVAPTTSTDPRPPEVRILEDARDTITGERLDQYGAAEDSFGGISVYWRNHIKLKYGMDVPLDNMDAAIMMTLFKLAREANAPKRDNRLDGIGYLALTERMVD